MSSGVKMLKKEVEKYIDAKTSLKYEIMQMLDFPYLESEFFKKIINNRKYICLSIEGFKGIIDRNTMSYLGIDLIFNNNEGTDYNGELCIGFEIKGGIINE